jgi:ribosome-associated protein
VTGSHAPGPTGASTSPALDESREVAIAAARAIDEKKGEGIVGLAVGQVLAITEWFVITSAANRRLVRTLAEEVEEQVFLLHDRKPLRVEGINEAQWVLLDYGDVVVHVFTDETRRFYEIERLYRDVERLDWQPTA